MPEECSINWRHTISNVTHQLTYDLCPLFLKYQAFKHEIDEETPPTHTKHVYEIALGKGIRKDGTLPADLQCSPNSFICLTVINTRPNNPSDTARILQVVTVASEEIRPKFRLTNTTTGLDVVETHLQLTVHGMQYQRRNQRGVFHMFCDETTKPMEFLYNWNGTHAFTWRSNEACPEATPQPSNPEPDPEDDDNTGEDLPPSDPEPETDEPIRSSGSLWPAGFAILILLIVFRKWLMRHKYVSPLLSRLPIRRRDRSRENELLLEEFGSGQSVRGLQYLLPDTIPHKYTK